MGNLHGVGGAPRWQWLIAPAVASASLSLLFLGVYGGTNWFTSTRTGVRTWVFEWEYDWIPFVPEMIIPYMSIDLFFVVAPFLCRDRAELNLFAKRIVFVILIAGVCFLLFPLKLADWAATKPTVDGWLGWIFTTFCAMDQPYNLSPSLHIALRTILAAHYALHSVGLVRTVLHVWFSLIGLSTLLTYQHHVIDIFFGFVLATVCFYLLRSAESYVPAKNVRIAIYYGLAAIALAVLAALTWPWGGVLLWPVVSLAIATAGYCGLGAAIYRKSAGVLPLRSRIVLLPLLVGQYLSLCYYRRQCRPWDEAAPHVLIGRQLSSAEANAAVKLGVTAVLDLTAEFSEAGPFRDLTYFNLPILDLTAPTVEQMRAAVNFISAESAKGTVYVHCKIGYSRSAAIVGAYLLASGLAASVDEAVAQLRRVRPSIVIRPEALAALRTFPV